MKNLEILQGHVDSFMQRDVNRLVPFVKRSQNLGPSWIFLGPCLGKFVIQVTQKSGMNRTGPRDNHLFDGHETMDSNQDPNIDWTQKKKKIKIKQIH